MKKKKFAQVIVPDDQLSLAIGKAGQNARLAAKVDNGKLIKSESQFRDDAKAQEEAESVAVATEEANNEEAIEEVVEEKATKKAVKKSTQKVEESEAAEEVKRRKENN